MKRKLSLLFIVLVIAITLTGCGKDYAKEFKKDYEGVNGTSNASGKIHRSVTIDEKNVFVEVEGEEIVDMVSNKETFYVYFGSRLCPWCRSVIEKVDEISRRRGIAKIYYVDIWDDEGKEILRDKMSLDDNGEPFTEKSGTKAYGELLDIFKDYLSDYTLTNKDGEKVSTGEKRIFAPNFMYVKNGNPEKLITGISELQKDSREPLTEEILKDEEKAINDFFTEACDDGC